MTTVDGTGGIRTIDSDLEKILEKHLLAFENNCYRRLPREPVSIPLRGKLYCTMQASQCTTHTPTVEIHWRYAHYVTSKIIETVFYFMLYDVKDWTVRFCSNRDRMGLHGARTLAHRTIAHRTKAHQTLAHRTLFHLILHTFCLVIIVSCKTILQICIARSLNSYSLFQLTAVSSLSCALQLTAPPLLQLWSHYRTVSCFRAVQFTGRPTVYIQLVSTNLCK